MLPLIAPLSCPQAAYTSGRSETPLVRLGTWPKISRSVSYISATAPVASSSAIVWMKVMSASFLALRGERAGVGDAALHPWFQLSFRADAFGVDPQPAVHR